MLRNYPKHVQDILFSHVTGHLVPGSMFILSGLWWLYNVIHDIVSSESYRLHQAKPYVSSVWYVPRFANRNRCTHLKTVLEPLVKISLGLIGSFMELTSGHWTLFDDKGEFELDSMNNFSHATMFSFFILSGIVDMMLHYGIISNKHLSKTGHLMMALAFFVEGFLFYFHLDGRSTIDSISHTILFFLCFTTSLTFVAESIWVGCGMLGLLRCFLVILQGSWFFQIAFMIYGPRKWSEKSRAATMLTPIAFAWHCFVIIAFIIAMIVLTTKCRRSSRFCSSDCEALSMEHLLGDEGENEDDGEIKKDLKSHSAASF